MSSPARRIVKHGKPRKTGVVNRSSSFNRLTPDGKLYIGGKIYANQYNYNKYRMRVNYVRSDGSRLVEGIDFYLDLDGYVVDGMPSEYQAQ